MMGVYQIKCNKNGKCYIGSSININARCRNHLSLLKTGKHYCQYLKIDFFKYGESSLTFSVLKTVTNPDELIKAEQKWLDLLKPEYNICPVAGSTLGVKVSDETKAKIGKPVKCLEENKTFKSAMDAARYYLIAPSNITRVCRGNLKKCGGFHWEYVV